MCFIKDLTKIFLIYVISTMLVCIFAIILSESLQTFLMSDTEVSLFTLTSLSVMYHHFLRMWIIHFSIYNEECKLRKNVLLSV